MKKQPAKDKTAPPPRLLTTEEVAAWLHVNAKTVRALVADGLLPVIRLGRGALRFDPKDVIGMIDAARRREPAPPTPTARVFACSVIPLSEAMERTDGSSLGEVREAA